MSSLRNFRVLVTRPLGQSSGLADLLRSHGAEPILIPTIEIAPPSSWCALDAALITLRTFDWIIFTSANAVGAVAQRARTLNLTAVPLPDACRLAAIGSATARAIGEVFARTPDLVPAQAVSESLAAALVPHAAGASMLLVRAAAARDLLPEVLTAAGASITCAEAYRNIFPEGSAQALWKLFSEHPPDAITFTSASTAANLAAILEHAGIKIPRDTLLASIGPITSAAMRDLGWEPAVEAEQATVSSLVESLAEYASRRDCPGGSQG